MKKFPSVFALALALFFAAQAAFALPAQVLLIRHAEKPEEGNELSEKGWERARALPGIFHNHPEFTKFGAPVALYGMAPKKKKNSVRAIQTLKYVSEDLHLPVIREFTDDDQDALVSQVKTKEEFNGKPVVICWNHDGMHDVAKALGVKHAPKMEKEIYDRVWVITFHGEDRPTLEDLPQHLLNGDSEK